MVLWTPGIVNFWPMTIIFIILALSLLVLTRWLVFEMRKFGQFTNSLNSEINTVWITMILFCSGYLFQFIRNFTGAIFSNSNSSNNDNMLDLNKFVCTENTLVNGINIVFIII